jgi:putative ABC transport system permease protein
VWAGPGFFELLGIPVVFGRAFDERDRGDTPRVAVISEAMARRQFGAVNAVGRRFRLERGTEAWLEVIGVVRDTGTADLGGDLVDPSPDLVYRSFAQWDVPPTTVLARTPVEASTLVGAMQAELRAVDAAVPVLSAQTMAQHLDSSLGAVAAVAKFLGALGGLGLCLAGIGLYAVVAFAVSRRSREIGIRMALGAQRQQVVNAVTREVAVLVAVGTALGLALSVLAVVALRLVVVPTPGIALYRPAIDPLALLTITGFMALVALAAAFGPARRAARLDPVVALRRG